MHVSTQSITTDPNPTFPVSIRTSPKTKRDHAVGVITAAALTRSYKIPRRDSKAKSGYQREVATARINKLVNDLEVGRVDLPTSVLLNLRDFQPAQHLVGAGDQLRFRPGASELFVVDGQHRIVALERLIERDQGRWAGFRIPFSCMLGATEREEMEEFYVVNSTAKSVRTDLALDLLKQRAETDPEVMKGLVERGENWKVEAQGIAEDLALTEIWRGRIRFPGDGAALLNSSAIVSSLRQLLSTAYFGAISRANRLSILDSFWRGIRVVLPEGFADPSDYVLQKATGVMALHTFLISVIEYIRSKPGMSVIDHHSYAEAMKDPLLNLEGDTSSGSIVTGHEFWLTGPNGAAGSYSSNAGRRVLIARLKAHLPAPAVE